MGQLWCLWQGAERMGSHCKVTWLQSLGGEVSPCGLHPVEEIGEGGPGMVFAMGLKLQGALWHRGVAGEGM